MELAWALFKVVLGTVLEALLGALVEVLHLGRDRRDRWAAGLPDGGLLQLTFKNTMRVPRHYDVVEWQFLR